MEVPARPHVEGVPQGDDLILHILEDQAARGGRGSEALDDEVVIRCAGRGWQPFQKRVAVHVKPVDDPIACHVRSQGVCGDIHRLHRHVVDPVQRSVLSDRRSSAVQTRFDLGPAAEPDVGPVAEEPAKSRIRIQSVDEARALLADLIVMGLPYHTQFGSYQLGEESNYVLSHAPCRVWLVRDRLDPPKEVTP